MNFPPDSLPPSPASQDPLLQTRHDPLGLAAEDLGDLGLTGPGEEAHPLVIDDNSPQDIDIAEREPVTLTCQDLAHLGLWDTEDCCHGLCHEYAPVAPEPLHYRHVTVRGCCGSHQALNHLHPPPDDFIDRLFR